MCLVGDHVVQTGVWGLGMGHVEMHTGSGDGIGLAVEEKGGV